eukprot:386054_1
MDVRTRKRFIIYYINNKCKKHIPKEIILLIAKYEINTFRIHLHNGNLLLSQDKLSIKGKGDCKSYFALSEAVINNNQQLSNVYEWSIQCLCTLNCNHFCIGIIPAFCKHWRLCEFTEWPTSLINFNSSHVNGFLRNWKYGDIITIKLDYNKYEVIYYKNKNKIKNEIIQKNAQYVFAILMCASNTAHFKIVSSPFLSY